MQTMKSTTTLQVSSGCFECSPHRKVSLSGSSSFIWNQSQKLRAVRKCRVRVAAEEASSRIHLRKKPLGYHPLEEITESELREGGEARLTPAETTRTIIEVNSNAALMFSGSLITEEHDSIFWPDLPYMTDEHGNVYFRVKNDKDILHSLTDEDNFVQVIIGLDTKDLQSEIELPSPSEIDFGVDDLDDEDVDGIDEDDDDDDDEGTEDESWVSILGSEEDLEDDDGSFGDWAELDTMSTSHPLDFAKKLVEVVSDDPIDFMHQPPAGLIILGLLKPATIDENYVSKHILDHAPGEPEMNRVDRHEAERVECLGNMNRKLSEGASTWETGLEKGKNLGETAFYKLQMINIRLISAHGHQTLVEVDNLKTARPDAIAHSAAKIMSHLEAGGEETAQALKSLCWRCKGIRAEASSEYGAERQLDDLLFPKTHHFQWKDMEALPTEL